MAHAVEPDDVELGLTVIADDSTSHLDVGAMARIQSSVTDDERTCCVRPVSRRHGNDAVPSDAADREIVVDNIEDSVMTTSRGARPASLQTRNDLHTILPDAVSQLMQSVNAGSDSQMNVIPGVSSINSIAASSLSHSRRTCPALCDAKEQRAVAQSSVTGCQFDEPDSSHCHTMSDMTNAQVTVSQCPATAGSDAYCQLHLMPSADRAVSQTGCGMTSTTVQQLAANWI